MKFSHLLDILFRRTRSFSYTDPARDWIFLLISSTIVLSVIVVWNAWAFDTVAGGGTIGSSAITVTPIFDQSSLEIIHRVFVERALEEGKYVSGIYQYADPSQ